MNYATRLNYATLRCVYNFYPDGRKSCAVYINDVKFISESFRRSVESENAFSYGGCATSALYRRTCPRPGNPITRLVLRTPFHVLRRPMGMSVHTYTSERVVYERYKRKMWNVERGKAGRTRITRETYRILHEQLSAPYGAESDLYIKMQKQYIIKVLQITDEMFLFVHKEF